MLYSIDTCQMLKKQISENAQLESHMTGGDMHMNTQGSNMDHVETH